MGKRTAITERTRETLIRAFWNCYEKMLLGELTVKHITQAAGYNRSTFYLYFDDMDDLRNQAEEQLLGRIRDILDEAIASGFSQSAKEQALKRLAAECGWEVHIVLGPWGDLRFQERFKELLHFLVSQTSLDEADAVLVCELTSAVIVSSCAYLTAHPDADPARITHVLDTYLRGGVMGVLAAKAALPKDPETIAG